jgi:hypothetical protein
MRLGSLCGVAVHHKAIARDQVEKIHESTNFRIVLSAVSLPARFSRDLPRAWGAAWSCEVGPDVGAACFREG